MGVVNTVKTLSQSAGPTVTGSMAQAGNFGAVFVVGGVLKAGYDLALVGLWLSRRAPAKHDDIALPNVNDNLAENEGESDETRRV